MSVKEHVTQQVKKIVREGNTVDENIVSFVKTDFHKTLADCDKTGRSVKQATKDTLDGVQAGLEASGHKTKDLLVKSADAIVEATHDITVQSLDAARTHADDAKALVDRAVDKSFAGMDKLDAKVKDGMEKAHTSLQEKTEAEKQKLHEVGEAIREYAGNKALSLNDGTRSALRDSAGKSKAHLRTLAQASEEHSKKLLHHSHTKVAEWLEC